MPAVNSKNVSIADIAAKLKLSKAAVSFALSGSNMVSNTTKQRVLKTAADFQENAFRAKAFRDLSECIQTVNFSESVKF